jgi:hypothetical protein
MCHLFFVKRRDGFVLNLTNWQKTRVEVPHSSLAFSIQEGMEWHSTQVILAFLNLEGMAPQWFLPSLISLCYGHFFFYVWEYSSNLVVPRLRKKASIPDKPSSKNLSRISSFPVLIGNERIDGEILFMIVFLKSWLRLASHPCRTFFSRHP